VVGEVRYDKLFSLGKLNAKSILHHPPFSSQKNQGFQKKYLLGSSELFYTL
jgi:hypothetical protein